MARARLSFERFGGFAVVAAAVFLSGCASTPTRKDTARPKTAIKREAPGKNIARPNVSVEHDARRKASARDQGRNKAPVTVGNTDADIKRDQIIGQDVNILNLHEVRVAKQCSYRQGTCKMEYCSSREFLKIFSGIRRSEKADKDVAVIMQGLFQNAELSCRGNARFEPLVANLLAAVNRIVENRN